jgi:hypothetical protein
MTEEEINRARDMLKSGDQEMCHLAIMLVYQSIRDDERSLKDTLNVFRETLDVVFPHEWMCKNMGKVIEYSVGIQKLNKSLYFWKYVGSAWREGHFTSGKEYSLALCTLIDI